MQVIISLNVNTIAETKILTYDQLTAVRNDFTHTF